MLNNKAIILIEDDQVDVMSFKRCLKNLEIENSLYIFQNGHDFIEFTKQNSQIPIGIVFLDLNTPKLSGLEFLKLIKENEELKLIPIIIVSTSIEENDVKEAYLLGIRGYITKSVNNEDFFEHVELCFNYWDKQNLIV